jgi:hypothetical protein
VHQGVVSAAHGAVSHAEVHAEHGAVWGASVPPTATTPRAPAPVGEDADGGVPWTEVTTTAATWATARRAWSPRRRRFREATGRTVLVT